MKRYSVLAMATLMLLGVAARGEELVDNPDYLSWAGCKVGSTVTRDVATARDRRVDTVERTDKLVELNGEKAIIETTVSIKGKAKTEKSEIRAKVTKAQDPTQPPADFQGKITQLADEDLLILGKTYRCHVGISTLESQGTTCSIKMWFCSQIPGRQAKGELKSTSLDGKGTDWTTTTTLTAIDLK